MVDASKEKGMISYRGKGKGEKGKGKGEKAKQRLTIIVHGCHHGISQARRSVGIGTWAMQLQMGGSVPNGQVLPLPNANLMFRSCFKIRIGTKQGTGARTWWSS